MAEAEQARETVSIEAHERVKTERDQLKAQLEQASTALQDFTKMEAARKFFNPDLAEVEEKVSLVLPHLREIPVEQVGEVLGQDRFKFLVPAPVETPPEAEPEAESPTPPPRGFGGPSPAGNEPAPSPSKLTRRSPEFQELVRRNDREAIERLYKEGRIEAPVRNY